MKIQSIVVVDVNNLKEITVEAYDALDAINTIIFRLHGLNDAMNAKHLVSDTGYLLAKDENESKFFYACKVGHIPCT